MTFKYKSYYNNFFKIFRIVFPVIAVLLGISLIFNLAIGFKVLAIIGIIILVLLTLMCLKNYNQSFDVDYDNIESVVEKGNDLIITNKDKSQITLREYYFDEDDLIDFSNHLEKYNINIEQVDKELSALQQFEQSPSFSYLFLLSAIPAIILLIGMYTNLLKNTVIVVLLSVIIPLIVFALYVHIFMSEELEILDKHRAGFLMGMVAPVVLGWAALYSNFASSKTMPIIIASLIIFIIVYILYNVRSHLLSAGVDYLVLLFLLLILPMCLLYTNNAVTVESETITPVVTKVSTSSGRFGLCSITFKDSDDQNVRVHVDAENIGNYKKGDTVTIKSKTGIFGITTYSIE